MINISHMNKFKMWIRWHRIVLSNLLMKGNTNFEIIETWMTKLIYLSIWLVHCASNCFDTHIYKVEKSPWHGKQDYLVNTFKRIKNDESKKVQTIYRRSIIYDRVCKISVISNSISWRYRMHQFKYKFYFLFVYHQLVI